MENLVKVSLVQMVKFSLQMEHAASVTSTPEFNQMVRHVLVTFVAQSNIL